MSETATTADWSAFWKAIDEAPGDFTRHLVFADWCQERGKPHVAFALRWAALFGRRPVFRPDVKRRPWQWHIGGSTSPASKLIGKHAPYCVLDRGLLQGAGRKVDLATLWYEFADQTNAYLWLADTLLYLREKLGITAAMPPTPEAKS